jgi:hypothetical protein
MALSLKAIDRLFDRLTLVYGRAFMAQWEGIPDRQLQDLKTLWSDELSQFSERLESVAWALENLPPRAPNVVEFRNLCHSAPRAPEAQLPEPAADKARVAAELSKLADVKKAAKSAVHRHDHKAWAKTLIARDAAGERVRPISLRFAKEALRLHLDVEAA